MEYYRILIKNICMILDKCRLMEIKEWEEEWMLMKCLEHFLVEIWEDFQWVDHLEEEILIPSHLDLVDILSKK